MDRPNIVLLVLDTQRANRLSCYGYSAETSPHIDRFSTQATKFTQAVSTSQWTLPAHASMFTGLYPSQHTMSQLNSLLPSTIATLPERLQQAGYFTAAFSNNPLIGAKQNGLQRGFHKIMNYSSVGYGLWVSHLEDTTHTNLLSDYRQRARRLLARILGYGRSVNWVSELVGPILDNALKFKGGSKTYNAEQSLTAASDLLVNRNGVDAEQPVFVFINLMGTHIPYAPSPRALRRFVSPHLGRRSTYAALHSVNSIGLDVNNWLETPLSDAEYRGLLNGVYDAEVATQDAQVGQFIKHLEKSGVLDQTLFIIVADHGDHLGEKQRISHLFGAYQELIHVPLLIHDPTGNFSKGQTVDDAVSIRRLFHTILAATGVATVDEMKLCIGNSSTIAEYLVFAEAETPAWVIKRLEQQRPNLVKRNGYDQSIKTVYEGKYKLIVKGNNITELYKVYTDPDETNELSTVYPEQVARMKTLVNDFVEQNQPTVPAVMSHEEDQAVVTRLRDLGYL